MSTIKDLQALGAFVSDQTVEREIAFKIGGEDYKATIHVRRLSAGDYEELILSQQKGRSSMAEIISKAIRLGKDGRESMTFEQAYKLEQSVATAMVNAFNEVNASKKS